MPAGMPSRRHRVAPALLHPAAKPLLFALCLLPFAWLLYAAMTNKLGANPAEYLSLLATKHITRLPPPPDQAANRVDT